MREAAATEIRRAITGIYCREAVYLVHIVCVCLQHVPGLGSEEGALDGGQLSTELLLL